MKTVKVLTQEFGYSAVKLALVTGASFRTATRWIKNEADPLPIFDALLHKLVIKEQRKQERKQGITP